MSDLSTRIAGLSPENLDLLFDRLNRQSEIPAGEETISRRNEADSVTPLRPDYIAPRTRVEKIVAEIWAEVLGLEQIGVHNSFFELGAHSLLVMRVASRIYKAFKVDLSLHDFFNAPTVADLGMTIVLRHAESQDREQIAQALAGLE